MEIVEAYGIDAAPAARGHVVDDVLRAFTCAAFAFERGAEAIVLVSTTDEAFVDGRILPERGAAEICRLSYYGFNFRGADREDWLLFDDDCWDHDAWTPPRTTEGFRTAIRAHARHVVNRYGPASLRV